MPCQNIFFSKLAKIGLLEYAGCDVSAGCVAGVADAATGLLVGVTVRNAVPFAAVGDEHDDCHGAA
jgi:hypothetical protein